MEHSDDVSKLAEFAGHVETVRFHVRWGFSRSPFSELPFNFYSKSVIAGSCYCNQPQAVMRVGWKRGEWDGSKWSPFATLTKNKNNALNVNAIRRCSSRFIHQRFYLSDCAYKKLLCKYLKDKICAKHKHKPLIHCIVLPRYLDWKANCKLPFIKD